MGSGISAPETPKELVLVGMGTGNAYLLRTITDKGWLGTVFNITVFDRKDALHHSIAGPRAVVDDSMVDRQYWDYSLFEKMLVARSKKGTDVKAAYTFHHATVTSVTSEAVTATTAAGEEITKKFDMCVVGTGSNTPFPGKSTDALVATSKAQYRRLRELVEAANSIVIVGGGPTGIEMAGEIAYNYGGGKAAAGGGKAGGKKVTLVNNGDTLLHVYGLKPKVKQRAAEKLASLGVDVQLGQRVDLDALRAARGDESKAEGEAAADGEGKAEAKTSGDEAKAGDALPDNVFTGPVTVTTNKGGSIEADLVLVCTGFRVNSAPYAASLAGSMDERGSLNVDLKQQVKGHEGRIFAIGDCSNTGELKLGYIAATQGKWLGKALGLFAVGKGASVKPRKPEGLSMLITIGPKDGVGQINGMVVGKRLIPAMKGGDYFVGRMRGEVLGKVK